MPLSLTLSPHGRLFVEEQDDAPELALPEVGARVQRAFAESAGRGLLHLTSVELATVLPPAIAFWREFGRTYLTQLCHVPDLDAETAAATPVPFPSEAATALLEQAPPMRGLEYLSPTVFERLWAELDTQVREDMRQNGAGAQAYLKSLNPLWNLVGRVTFHLAENKKDADLPFAFMATYTSRISNQAKLQYLPLGRALQEYSGARNRGALLSLLAPVHRAAEASALIKGLVESGDVFHPLAWTPPEAYRFLKDIPAFERSGVIVRVPDWWKPGNPARPRATVRIGDKKKAGLGIDALLDFSMNVSLDGEELTPQEIEAILASSQGLVLLKGRWVEVDREKLADVLKHWRTVQKVAGSDGISFLEGMRLLAGAGADKQDAEVVGETVRDWSQVIAGDWLEKVLRDLRDPRRIGDGGAIGGLQAELREYQKVGVNWLWFMQRLGLGACLADDMGLGKTVQVLALLLRLRQEREMAGRQDAGTLSPRPCRGGLLALPGAIPCASGAGVARVPRPREDAATAAAAASGRGREAMRPSLLLAPASLLGNWRAEIARFAPSLRVVFAHPSEAGEAELAEIAAAPETRLAGVDLVVTTYGMALRLEWLRATAWDLLVLDEAQAIKNPGARQTRVAKQLQSRCRIALTGTPVENRLSDLWSLFDFLNSGLLGSAPAFGRFTKALAAATTPNPYAPLRALVRPYLLRRLKTDKTVIADLPDKTEVTAYCALSKAQAVLYEQTVHEMESKLETLAGIERRGMVLAYIMRLKQICNHPAQLLGNGAYAPADSGKFARLRELCEEMAARQEKTLVFTQFREMTEPLAQFLAAVFGRPGLVLHGGTAVKDRRALVDAFQTDGGPPFFVLSLKAGGTGLNLTEATQVVHFDRWWNPAVENQATDRAFRIGQKHNVLVHKFVCRGTMEEKIEAMLVEKKGLAESLVEGGAEKLLTEMSNAELIRFVSLDLAHAAGE
ncbi:MAG: helicase [Lentisphaerae bacterium RIFOXYB12_FULL_65_16]|nr:MAG: helicase [Lentisphaerae bacterium RIFOXYA12_64_32]OGV85356.1 MAG: helicase [Lentisphaerae bacterium RIFOXYB12_FULL_65_16]